jgi:hypothetical protein
MVAPDLEQGSFATVTIVNALGPDLVANGAAPAEDADS